MVDLMEAQQTQKTKLKFNPKFEDSPSKKKAKKHKHAENGSNQSGESPAKKIKKPKMEKTPQPQDENKENKGHKKEKKKVKINTDVEVKEIPKTKKDKKFKLETKIKKKFVKAGGKPFDNKAKGKFKGGKKDKVGGNNTVKMLNKQETREKQKKVKEIRKKFKQEDVFDIGIKAKKVWEEVRREDCPEEKKDKLINELHSLIKGNIKKIIFAHDTVRVVECLMALGSADIRDKLFNEMKGDILEMTKSKYAHFFVQKMLRYGTKDQKNIIYKEMQGNIAKLMKNKTAGYVVEMLYNDIANGPQRNAMLQEFLDQQFLLFKDPEVRTVPEIVAKYPDRAKDIIANLQKNVEVLIRKGCYNHSLAHTVIYNYLLVAEPKPRAEIIEQLRESLIHMVHSREGAYAALQCIWHGTTKDRKAIIKSFKTFMTKTALEEYGHNVLLGIFDSVDDTKLVGKAVIGELMENLEELFNNKYGVRVVKYLFCGRDPTYINKDQIAILEKGDRNEHSKKDAAVRRSELVAVAAPPVLAYIQQRIPASLYESATSITLTCILNQSPASTQLTETFTQLAKLVCKPFEKGDAAPNLVENTGSNMLFKKLIMKDGERQKKEELTFSSVLIGELSEDSLDAWLSCNRGCLLLLTLINTEIKELVSTLKTMLKPMSKTIAKLDSPSGKILQEKLQSL